MNKEIVVSKKLYDSVVNENIKLKIMVSNYKRQLELLTAPKDQPMERQISIEEYTKTLKPKQTKEEK